MKKIILGALIALTMASLSAQVMGSTGVRNTLWAGCGSPDTENKDFTFYGFTDTLQARVDIAQFTMEGMVNWGFFIDFDANGSRYIEFTPKTAFYASNHISDIYSSSYEDSLTDPYYVNFLWHPLAGLDFGVGTRLEWKVGVAPACGDYYWGKGAHVKQGGLKKATPGNTDVAGFVYYPNSYARTAVGVRYSYKDMFQIGFAIPSGISASGFDFNAGISVHPMSFFTVSFAYENICSGSGNLYAGLELFIQKNFTLNIFYAMDNVGNNTKSGVNGIGTNAVISIPKMNLTITPEFGMTFYENDDYTNAFYFGSGIDFGINKQFTIGTWLSFAFGSENKYWHVENALERANHGVNALNYNITNKWSGGTVFDIRPYANMNINSNNDVALYLDYQQRTMFNNTQYGNWSFGMFWTYTH